MGMNGFVRSRRPAGVYCMKRHISPGQEISLDDLFEQYGTAHSISEGPEFVKWLRTVKLRRRDIWEIMYNNESIVSGNEPFKLPKKVKPVEVKEEVRESGKVNLEGDIVVESSEEINFSFPSKRKETAVKPEKLNDESRFTKVTSKGGSVKAVKARNDSREMPAVTPKDILGLRVDSLDEIDKVKDIRILRVALKAAEETRGKAMLCKRLKVRINKLKPKSRFNSV